MLTIVKWASFAIIVFDFTIGLFYEYMKRQCDILRSYAAMMSMVTMFNWVPSHETINIGLVNQAGNFPGAPRAHKGITTMTILPLHNL